MYLFVYLHYTSRFMQYITYYVVLYYCMRPVHFRTMNVNYTTYGLFYKLLVAC